MQGWYPALADELIAAVYEAAAEVVSLSRPLELLAALTRSDKAFVGRFNFEHRRGSVAADFNLDFGYAERYELQFASRNPWLMRRSYFQAEGLVWRGSEILDHDALRKTEFYQHFLAPLRILNTVQIVIRVHGADIVHVVLGRRPEADDYDEATLNTCRLFALHAQHALKMRDSAETSRLINEGLTAAIDELPVGVAVIEPPSALRYMSGSCYSMFFGQPSGRMAAPNGTNGNGRASHAIRLPRALEEALSKRPVPSTCIVQPHNGEVHRPLFVEIRPYQTYSELETQPRIGYVLIARTANTELEVDTTALRDAFHLTAAEARICASLVTGDTVDGLAKHLGISPYTARTHVKHIFEKTYTNRQPELMKFLLSLARRKSEMSLNGADNGAAAASPLGQEPTQNGFGRPASPTAPAQIKPSMHKAMPSPNTPQITGARSDREK